MRDRLQWIPRLVCLALILLMGAGYQARALDWQQLWQENQEELEAAEAHNEEVRAEELRRAKAAEASTEEASTLEAGAEEEETVQVYADGVYTGSGQGFGGEILVSVTLEADQITAITIDQADGEDSVYLSTAEQIIDDILSAQTADVDTITGATFSSTGIREAVRSCLEQAEAAT